MKRIPLSILALGLICISHAPGQVQPTPPTIRVSGKAEIRVTPDLVDINFGIDVIGKDLPTTEAAAMKRVDAVIACLKKAGIADKDIQTNRVSIYPHYAERSATSIKPDGYNVDRMISCTLRDVEKFDEVLSAALQAGATDVNGIYYRTTELLKHRDAARIAALRAARDKANLLATELGMKVGRAQSVVEDVPGGSNTRGYDYEPPQVSEEMIAGMRAGKFTSGQISISAAFCVTFALE